MSKVIFQSMLIRLMPCSITSPLQLEPLKLTGMEHLPVPYVEDNVISSSIYLSSDRLKIMYVAFLYYLSQLLCGNHWCQIDTLLWSYTLLQAINLLHHG